MTKVPKRNEPGGLVLRAKRLFVQKYDCVGNRLNSSVPFGLKNLKCACAGKAGLADQVIFPSTRHPLGMRRRNASMPVIGSVYLYVTNVWKFAFVWVFVVVRPFPLSDFRPSLQPISVTIPIKATMTTAVRIFSVLLVRIPIFLWITVPIQPSIAVIQISNIENPSLSPWCSHRYCLIV